MRGPASSVACGGGSGASATRLGWAAWRHTRAAEEGVLSARTPACGRCRGDTRYARRLPVRAMHACAIAVSARRPSTVSGSSSTTRPATPCNASPLPPPAWVRAYVHGCNGARVQECVRDLQEAFIKHNELSMDAGTRWLGEVSTRSYLPPACAQCAWDDQGGSRRGQAGVEPRAARIEGEHDRFAELIAA